MYPPASICSLSLMKMSSRGGAPRAQLSTHGFPCFLNPLDTPTQEQPPASLDCGTLAEHCSRGMRLLHMQGTFWRQYK